MKAPINQNEIRVRYSSYAYVARCQGKTASCTAGAKQAAEAVAKKVWGHSCKVVWVEGTECGKSVWRIEE